MQSTSKNHQPRFSAIIIHWNTPDLLRKLLEKLPVSDDLEVIVVDNNSSESLDKLKKTFDAVRWIEQPNNSGFAAAGNRGASVAQGEWLVFLNADVDVSPETLQTWLSQTQQNHWLASSPHSTSDGYALPLLTPVSMLFEYTPLTKVKKMLGSRHQTLTGGLLLVRSDTFRELGGWDERFFLWFEDSDLTLRLEQKQVPHGFVPLVVQHLGGSSFKSWDSQQRRDIFFHALEVFARKHWNAVGIWLACQIRQHYSKRLVLPALCTPVTVVVPNVKLELLESFLSSHASLVSDSAIELCAVTSAFNSEKLWDFRRQYPTVRFISIHKNMGFAHTVNIGLRVGRSPWAATVNDDVLLENNVFMQLRTAANDKKVASISPVVLTKTGAVESTGITVLPRGKAVPVTQIPAATVQTDANNGACMLFNQEALNQVGLFDESFESYLEDVDLSLRFSKNGWLNLVEPSISITHFQHQTSASNSAHKKALDVKNWWRILYKHWPLERWIRFGFAIMMERLRNISGYAKELAK